MPDVQEYAFRPPEIKKIIVVGHGGEGIQTYETLLDAMAAVYRLSPAVQQHINQIIQKTSEQPA